MTWEHYTIAALWVLGACACAAIVGLRNPHKASFVGAFVLLMFWPGVIFFAVCAGLWDWLTTPPWARHLD